MNTAKADFFDTMALAPWAATQFRPEDGPKIERLLAAGGIGPGAQVLEPGCGTGRLTAILADAVEPSGRVVALDISPKMVEACRARLGRRRRVEIVRAAVEEYPVEPAAFDVCVCHQVFPHFDDPAAALRTLVRSLKPGGRLLVVHFINAAAVNEIHQAGAAPIQRDHLPQPDEMRGCLTDAGLAVDWWTDDPLGYLVRGIRSHGAVG